MNGFTSFIENTNPLFWAVIYFLGISAVGVVLTINDKSKAIQQKWRIRESTLMLVGGLGGATAMLITMKKIRHKTKKKKFMIGLPVEIILHISLIVTIVFKTIF